MFFYLIFVNCYSFFIIPPWFDERSRLFSVVCIKLSWELQKNFAAPFIDDLLIYSATSELGIDNLRLFLRDWRNAVNVSKSILFKKEIFYFGKIITTVSFTKNSRNIIGISSKLRKKLRPFTGFESMVWLVRHFQHLIWNLSHIAHPFYQLLKKNYSTDKEAKKFITKL